MTMTYNTDVNHCVNWLNKQFSKSKGVERELLLQMAEKERYSKTTLKAAIQITGVNLFGVFDDLSGDLLYCVWRKH